MYGGGSFVPCKYQGDGNGLVGILMSTYSSIDACCDDRRADGTNSNPSGTCIGQGKVLYILCTTCYFRYSDNIVHVRRNPTPPSSVHLRRILDDLEPHI